MEIEGSRASGKTAIKDIFERWSQGSMASSMEWGHPPFHKWWLKRLSLAENSKVLDIGCGTGWASRMVAKMVPHGEVVGLDLAEGMVKKARQLISKDKPPDYENLSFEVADAEDIPYPNDYFDCVICVESFSWYPDPSKAVREMGRVLKPEGRLYVADIPDGQLLRPILKVLKLFVPGLDKWNIYSESQFKGFLEAEFENVYQKKANWIYLLWGGGRVLLTVGTKTKVKKNA